MKPTRSANRTLTSRRSVVASAAAGVPVDAMGSPRTIGRGGSAPADPAHARAGGRRPRGPRGAGPARHGGLWGAALAAELHARRVLEAAGRAARREASAALAAELHAGRILVSARGAGHAHSLEVRGGPSVADGGRDAKQVVTPRAPWGPRSPGPGKPARLPHGRAGRAYRRQAPRRGVRPARAPGRGRSSAQGTRRDPPPAPRVDARAPPGRRCSRQLRAGRQGLRRHSPRSGGDPARRLARRSCVPRSACRRRRLSRGPRSMLPAGRVPGEYPLDPGGLRDRAAASAGCHGPSSIGPRLPPPRDQAPRRRRRRRSGRPGSRAVRRGVVDPRLGEDRRVLRPAPGNPVPVHVLAASSARCSASHFVADT